MSVSLWCEEEEGQSQAQEQDSARGEATLRARWDPSVSGQRVVQRLLQLEERYLPSPLYIALVQRDPQRREELAKWAMEVCCDCSLDEAVFPLCVSLLDRYLSATLSLPVSPYCLAAACVLIASKLTESHNVSADALCAAADHSFLPSSLREMERVVLGTLRWDTAAVTPQDFIPHFLPAFEQRTEGDTGALVSTLRRHGDTLVAMCVCDSRFLGAPPSLLAAAALDSALRGLGHQGAERTAHSTLARLCQADEVVLQCYSELIDAALTQRLGSGPQSNREEKEGEMEDERAGTPTDMREVDF
ncbi:cyclin Dx [Osmerus mordax]|uniref:cyclin Dx n=1 Tax=Osmerus mordax TaxID=8014 RepID=UPI00351029CC